MSHIWNAVCRVYQYRRRQYLRHVKRRSDRVRSEVREPCRRLEPRPQRERLAVVQQPRREQGDWGCPGILRFGELRTFDLSLHVEVSLETRQYNTGPLAAEFPYTLGGN